MEDSQRENLSGAGNLAPSDLMPDIDGIIQKKLTPRQYEICVLWLDGLKHKNIGQKLGTTRENITKAISLIKKKLPTVLNKNVISILLDKEGGAYLDKIRRIQTVSLKNPWYFWSEKSIEQTQKAEENGEKLEESEGYIGWVSQKVAQFKKRLTEERPADCRCAPSQFEAYLWVCCFGYPQWLAAKRMGISQPAVSKKLTALFSVYPIAKPTDEIDWGLTPRDKLFGDFEDFEDGERPPYHKPGKTSWPITKLRGEGAMDYTKRKIIEKKLRGKGKR